MMEFDDQLKLQAFLDGELPEAEAKAVAGRVARDPEAAALLSELRQTRQAMTGFEKDVRLPESREFYWSKLQRELERLDAPSRKPEPAPLLLRLRRFLVPAAAFALLAIAGLLAVPRRSHVSGAELADSGGFVYHDYAAGTTLVWLSYPAENEVAQDDETDTLD